MPLLEFIHHFHNSTRIQALSLAVHAGADNYDSKVGKVLAGAAGLGVGLAGEASITVGGLIRPGLRDQQLRMWNEVNRERQGKPFLKRVGVLGKGLIRNSVNGLKYVVTGSKTHIQAANHNDADDQVQMILVLHACLVASLIEPIWSLDSSPCVAVFSDPCLPP
jgi:hypothetical protein